MTPTTPPVAPERDTIPEKSERLRLADELARIHDKASGALTERLRILSVLAVAVTDWGVSEMADGVEDGVLHCGDVRAAFRQMVDDGAQIASLRAELDSWKSLSRLSVNGLNIYGNDDSMKAARAWMHAHEILEPIREYLIARAEAAEMHLKTAQETIKSQMQFIEAIANEMKAAGAAMAKGEG